MLYKLLIPNYFNPKHPQLGAHTLLTTFQWSVVIYTIKQAANSLKEGEQLRALISEANTKYNGLLRPEDWKRVALLRITPKDARPYWAPVPAVP
jgi:hypothetical protein